LGIAADDRLLVGCRSGKCRPGHTYGIGTAPGGKSGDGGKRAKTGKPGGFANVNYGGRGMTHFLPHATHCAFKKKPLTLRTG
jgi:hypothetical protein